MAGFMRDFKPANPVKSTGHANGDMSDYNPANPHAIVAPAKFQANSVPKLKVPIKPGKGTGI